MQFIIASRNLHKIREIKEIFRSNLPNFELLSLLDFPLYTPLLEEGKSFEENAIIKAEHAAKILKSWVISDDSGLVLPILNDAPGIYSARYAKVGATDKENRDKLLKELENIADDQRIGFFECVMAIASPTGIKKLVKASCEGKILKKEKGSGGFGYDSLFVKNEYSKTFAELSGSLKIKISHRGKAFDKLVAYLENLQQNQNKNF